MTWHLAGEDLAFLFDFKVDGEFVEPSAASLTLRDHAGSILSSGNSLTIDGTQAVFTVDGADNTLSGGRDFENRFIWVTFIYEGQSYYLDRTYQIHSFIPMSARPHHVREAIGADIAELADDEIDVHRAYFQLKNDLGATFTDALVGEKSLDANRAIVLKAAINLATSLELRIATKMTAEEQTFQRSSELRLTEVRRNLENELASTLNAVTGEDNILINLFSKITPTDPITGA